MEEKVPVFACKRVKFYSPFDEDMFFKWLKKIKCVEDIRGERDQIFFSIHTEKVKNQELRELVALFRRYKIDIKQLEVLVDETNKELFLWSKKNGHINVYPAKPQS